MQFLYFIIFLCALAPSVQAAEDTLFPPPSQSSMSTPEANSKTEDVYVCPMHNHIHGKKGEKCPICGMDLVPQQPPETPKVEGMSGSIQIGATYQQDLGVRTEVVSRHLLGQEIQAFGIIEPSTRTEYAVAVRKSGWITSLNTSAVGDIVKQGDLLFTLYSPDLMAAQADYLLSNRGSASQRLRLFGMDDKAIELLNQKGRVLEETPFYAPANGIVTALNARKGSHVDGEGSEGPVISLQDISQVWVKAYVPIRDLDLLQIGMSATVSIKGLSDSYQGKIDFIYPNSDEDTRKGMVRIILDNANGALKIGASTEVIFMTNAQPRIAIPEEAILHDKSGAHVIEALKDNHFRPLTVKTGINADGYVEIISGLSEGQRIVTSGQFMIDAESNLRGGFSSMDSMKEMESGDAH